MAKQPQKFYPKTRQSPYLVNRNREVRDLYNKLRKTYRYDIVLRFIAENYFIQEAAVMQVLRYVDTTPVDLNCASVCYRSAIQETFKL